MWLGSVGAQYLANVDVNTCIKRRESWVYVYSFEEHYLQLIRNVGGGSLDREVVA